MTYSLGPVDVISDKQPRHKHFSGGKPYKLDKNDRSFFRLKSFGCAETPIFFQVDFGTL